MSNFKIGEKVVCVAPNYELILNEIYTVEGFNPYDGGLILEELKSEIGFTGAFKKERFRKLDHKFGEDVCAEIIKKVKEESLISVN